MTQTCREHRGDVDLAEANKVHRFLGAGVVWEASSVSGPRDPATLEGGLREIHHLSVSFQQVLSDLQLVDGNVVNVEQLLSVGHYESPRGSVAVVSW